MTIVESAGEIGGVTCKNHSSKLSEKTKQLMKPRREMSVDNRNTSSRIECIELCKTFPKSIKEDIRKFNCELVCKAIENSRSIWVIKGSLSIGTKHIVALKGEDVS